MSGGVPFAVSLHGGRSVQITAYDTTCPGVYAHRGSTDPTWTTPTRYWRLSHWSGIAFSGSYRTLRRAREVADGMRGGYDFTRPSKRLFADARLVSRVLMAAQLPPGRPSGGAA